MIITLSRQFKVWAINPEGAKRDFPDLPRVLHSPRAMNYDTPSHPPVPDCNVRGEGRNLDIWLMTHEKAAGVTSTTFETSIR